MDWNNLGGPLRGGGGVLLQVMIGTKFEEEKKNTMILLFIIIKYVMFVSHAAIKILKMSIQASITLN